MNQYILGIETSCDETAAAVYHQERGILSSVLYSQMDLHRQYGGVIPEIASRSHIEKMAIIVQQALDAAHLMLDDIGTIAVTNKPGLPGSLLVGLCFAKAVAWSLQKNVIGVNHLEGHIFSSFLEQTPPFPHLCLSASGGHTALYLVHNFGEYTLLGQTLDDAAGEAFDKIAKLMNLSYPGGPIIEKLAHQAGFQDFYQYPRGQHRTLDFSFSGLKTAVMYDLIKRNSYDMQLKQFTAENPLEMQQRVSSSLLVCVKDIFLNKLEYALSLHPHVKAITFVGGVACNKYIKGSLDIFCQKRNLPFFAPSIRYCTDNAAMIALVGSYKAQRNQYDTIELDIFE